MLTKYKSQDKEQMKKVAKAKKAVDNIIKRAEKEHGSHKYGSSDQNKSKSVDASSSRFQYQYTKILTTED